ncbi:TPA: autotransporter outer membrane beta-barrel domain-containing protein [Yersinia enterocolitica]
MENINNPRKYILKKSPIAKFVASVLFILGSYSAIADVNAQVIHKGNIDDRNIALINNQTAQNSVINGKGSLRLKDRAEANNTQVNTNSVSAIFSLTDNSRATNSKISHGYMLLLGQATALNTFVGLKKGEESGDKKLLGKMSIRNGGKAQNTTVSSGGVVRIENNGTAENTTVLKGGKLLITNEGNYIKLIGTILKGGELILDSDVTLEGETKILPNSTVNTDGHQIKNNGDLYFAGKDREMTATIEGSGSLTISNPESTFILKGVNIDTNQNDYSYSGRTNIIAGNLKLSQAKFTNSTITGEKDTKLILENSLLNTTTSGGHISIDIDENSRWRNRGYSSIGNLNIQQGGNLDLSSYPIDIDPLKRVHQPLANKLTITGNYHSDGGTLTFYSKLEGDDSETDRMVVEGNTSGHTNVKINNLGGKGAQTDSGILLIEVRGRSEGDFKQMGRNVAGTYEYFLRRGSEDDRNKNWYMISDAPKENKKEETPQLPESAENNSSVNSSDSRYHQVESVSYKHDRPGPRNNPPIKEEVAESAAPVPQEKDLKDKSDNTPAVKGSEGKENPPTKSSIAAARTPNKVKTENSNIPQKTYQPVYRPENGSYIANISMARNLFTSDLDNRSGNYKYKDAATGEWRTSSMWIQTQGGIKQFGKTVDQLNIKGKYYLVQFGGDVAKWDIGTQGSGRIGMLAGMGKATNHSKSNITGYYSNGSVNGYNLGVYATWLADQQNKTGLYIDTLAQYSWFNNAVNGQELAEEKYKSSGFTSSIESGYTFNIGSTEQLSYFIQPNAKITWVGINAQTHTATNKDIINYTNRGQLITRIGAKTYLQTTNNSEQQFMPFIAVNWLHQNHNTGTQLSGQGVENSSKNSAEFKIGVESKIDQRLHAWANINHQIGNYNTNDTNALVGIKYAF